MFHNGVEKGKLLEVPQEGDILVSFIRFNNANFFIMNKIYVYECV